MDSWCSVVVIVLRLNGGMLVFIVCRSEVKISYMFFRLNPEGPEHGSSLALYTLG